VTSSKATPLCVVVLSAVPSASTVLKGLRKGNFSVAKGLQKDMGGRGSCGAETAANGDWRLANGE